MSELYSEAAAVALPADHVRVLHGDARTGLVAVAQGPGWRESAVALRDLGRYVAQLEGSRDVYVSQGRFRVRRRVANFISINAAWVDLDCYKRGLSAEVALSGALVRCEDARVPVPSYAVSTGRGLAVVWLVEVLPRAALPRWQRVQAALIELLRDLGADPAARDAARVLRLVGSVNTKPTPPAPVRCVWPMGAPQAYSFEELCAAVLPLTRPEGAAKERVRARRRPRARSGVVAFPGTDLRAGRLWEARLGDLQRLLELRWFGTLPPGERDLWLFIASCAVAWLVPAGDAMRREVVELARQALGGAWSAPLVLELMGSAIRRASAAARGERVEWAGEEIDPRYRFRTSTIIDWLSISAEEQRELKVLVSADVRSARQAARGRLSGQARRARTRERDARILELRFFEGLSEREIASAVGVSRRTVRDVLARGSGVGGEPV